MSITGAALVLFLTFHAVMNIFVVIDDLASTSVYDSICNMLGAHWYVLIATAGLALLVCIHILFAFILTLRNYVARGSQRYAVSARPNGVEWSSQNMLVLGIIVLGFLALHLINFWAKMQLAEVMGAESAQGFALVSALFGHWWYCLLYMVWLFFLWFHLAHGVWSCMQTVGWNNNSWLPRLKCIARWWASIVCGLFALIPVYFLVKIIFAC